MPDSIYTLTVDLQVLKHLGIGLYSNVPAVISEMVANAYDADATEVKITVKDEEIIIQDNGLGMDIADANQKFLTVGYDKRASGETVTPRYKRRPMGRKGIGKLSVFAIANKVEIRSIKTDPESSNKIGECAFIMDVSKIESRAQEKKPYHPTPIAPSRNTTVNGTRIVLRDLKKKRSIKDTYVRINLARRFSVFGKKFQVFVNGQEVTPEDRQYWDRLQFVWGLGDCPSFKIASNGKKVRKSAVLSETVKLPGEDEETVSGWIGTVHFPKELKDGQIDNNGIVVMARGKLVHENILPFARTSRIFAEYVVGEIDADWLDEDSETDIATSDRQNLKENDPRFSALQHYVRERLLNIAEKWTEWRKEVGLKDAVKRHPVLQKWLEDMKPDNRRQAEKLISTIEGMPVSDPDDRKELLKHGIMAFETLALKGNLSVLANTPNLDWKSLKRIMSAMEDLEVAHYYEVAKIRWTVLKEMERLVDENEKEKFVQEKIYKNMWLLDVAWERATQNIRKEQRFARKLEAEKLGLDKNKQLSRFDIKYLAVSGKDLIVELKRGQRSLKFDEILFQVRKYAEIMTLLSKESTASFSTPNFDIIVLLGKFPTGYSTNDEKALSNYNARIVTYEKLIERARASYGDYLERQKKVERIQQMVEKL